MTVGRPDFDNTHVNQVGWEYRPYCKRPAAQPAERIADFDRFHRRYGCFSPAED